MPINNKNTAQGPVVSGLTGTQAIRWIAADRAYIKTSDVTATPVNTKSNGSTPSGWTDLGIINGKLQIRYEKELQEIRTGIDNVLRDTYVRQRTAGFEFGLAQFDDVVLKEVSGLSASQIVSNSTYRFRLGSEDVVYKAMLLVSQDKLTGKEWQFYHPNAQMSFNLEDDGEATVVRVTANLPPFTFETGEISVCLTEFA